MDHPPPGDEGENAGEDEDARGDEDEVEDEVKMILSGGATCCPSLRK